MTKSVRTATFKDLNKFLTFYKDNTTTNQCFISTMVNHIIQWRAIVKPLHNNFPQIISKCSTNINIMILIHSQPHDAQHKALQTMNLRLVNHLHQFSLLGPHEIRSHKKQYKGKGCPLWKGLVVRRNSAINWLMVFETRFI